MAKPEPFIVADLRGGRNDTDSPLALPMNQCVEALNVDWREGLLGGKRPGCDAVTDTGGTPFSSGVQTLFRHVPGADETAAEFWGIDGAATPIVKRMAAGTSFANVTMADAIASRPQDVVPVTLNGKVFLFYDSSVDRPHVYDPVLAKVRRMGFVDPSTAPTVANTGGGAYAATIRYYRVRWLQLNGVIVVRRSEPSDSVSFTPSGAGTAARVTRPTAAGEDETHWEIEASSDNVTFYRLSQIAIATTTYDDSATVSTYSTNTLSDVIGTYTPFPSCKYGMSDGNRILAAGAWETGGKSSTVYFSPVLGSSDQGDDERLVTTTTQKNTVALNENDGGGVTGMGGPLGGAPIIFKYRQIHKLVPTGDVSVPYIPRKISDGIGSISHKSIVLSEDEAGRPALYFMSHKGPYRLGANGLQFLGRDNRVMWASMNLGATSVVAHTQAHPDIHQVWFWIATGASNDPDVKMMFDTQLGFVDEHNQVRGGWAKHDGPSAAARCSTMMSATLGASMSLGLKPYIGRASGTAILKCDTTSLTDGGTNTRAYIKTRPLSQPLGVNVAIGQSQLLAKTTSGTAAIFQVIDRDYGVETVTASVGSLVAVGSETRVLKKIEGSDMSTAGAIQVTLGETAASGNELWTLDALMILVTSQEVR